MNDLEHRIPPIGLGTLRLCGETCISIVRKAIEMGYQHIDTAPVYHNHHDIREAIQPFDRQKLYITSKFLPEQGCINTACDLALNELGLDYLDLYLIHWPDRNQSMEEILNKLQRLKEQGKIRQYGVSNYTINHLKDMLDKGIKIPFNQVEFHPYLSQNELLDFCETHQVKLISYRPLGKGELLAEPLFEEIGQKHQKSAAQVILRWIYQKGIPILVKTTSEDRLKENFSIFDFSLSSEEMQGIDRLNCNKRYCVTKWADFDY